MRSSLGSDAKGRSSLGSSGYVRDGRMETRYFHPRNAYLIINTAHLFFDQPSISHHSTSNHSHTGVNMCRFSGHRSVHYTMACGHYSVYAGNIEPCAEAEAKTKLLSKGRYRPEQQICDAIINEIERQRPSDYWGFVCCIDGEPISVSVGSSGHCEAWLKQGYKRPTYQQEPEIIGNGISSTSSSTENELSRK